MKVYCIISFLGLILACQKEDADPVIKSEAEIGVPFTISSPAEVMFKETGMVLHITFDSYTTWGIVAPNTQALVRYDGRQIKLYHGLWCDDRDCEGYAHDENTYSEEARIGELYKLKFVKIVASTTIKDYGDGKQVFRVDSAQFVLTRN